MPPIEVQVAVGALLLRPFLVAVTTRRTGPLATVAPFWSLPSQVKETSPAPCAPSVSLWTTAPLASTKLTFTWSAGLARVNWPA